MSSRRWLTSPRPSSLSRPRTPSAGVALMVSMIAALARITTSRQMTRRASGGLNPMSVEDLPCLSVSIRVYNLYGPSVEDAEAIAQDALADMKFQFGRLMPDRDDDNDDGE